MTPTLYPNTAEKSCGASSAFFSAIPRAVGDLRAQGKLKPRDVDVLRELLDHKNQRTTQVDPLQKTLAARMGCALDTIQRSLNRLVQAGLITKRRVRDARGRLGRCIYDLAGTLALMPRQAAKLRSGQWGRAGQSPMPSDEGKASADLPITTPQKCGLSEVDSDSVEKADNRTSAPPNGPSSPVAAALAAQGVFPKAAAALVVKFGETRCREVLDAAARVKRFHRSKAAWIVAALTQSLPVAADTHRPRAHWPYTPPSAAGPPPDALALLSAEAYDALEQKARAQLWEETKPAWRDMLLNGRNPAYLRTRMRELLKRETSVTGVA